MTDPLFEQLKERIAGKNHALQTAGNLLYSMVSPRMMKQLQKQGVDVKNINALEEEFVKQGVYVRQITIGGKTWVPHTIGKILAFTAADDTPVLLVPGFRTYSFVHPYSGELVKITKNSPEFDSFFKQEAFSLTYPLPARPLKLKDIDKMALASINKSEMLFTLTACIGVMLLNMVSPFLNKIIFSNIIPSNDIHQLYPVAMILLSACVGLLLLTCTRSLVAFRLKDKVEYEMQSGLMARIFNMSGDIFKNYSPGELADRVLSISTFSGQITDAVLCAILSLLVSGLLGIQMFFFGGKLLWYAVFLLLISLFGTFMTFYYNFKSRTMTIPYNAKTQGLLYSLFSGIQKIKTSGAELFAFNKWAEVYSKSEYLCTPYSMRRAIATAGTYMFYCAVPFLIMIAAFNANMGLADYIAFTAVMAIALETVKSLKNVMTALSTAAPILKLATPILTQQPDTNKGSIIVHEVTGSIKINGLSFKYPGTSRKIFDDLSLTINPGEYVAIVGSSGCGKSTLLRLILGFEKPDTGSIFFDHYNLAEINKSSLRRNCISICQQNGRIFNGTVMENICFSKMSATEQEAWQAAELAAFDEDIRHMPNGIHTVIGDEGQNVSGGQRQRILIARALITNPKILLLDEATSALDNISQKIVSDNFRKIGCTRITIAHRLSTIRECDRIIVLDKGHVVEDGSFDELIAQNGVFAGLCKQQV